MSQHPKILEILRDIDQLLSIYRNPDLRQASMARIERAIDALIDSDRLPDEGPWEVSTSGRSISSDSFDHDIRLKVDGDFCDEAARHAYSLKLAQQLNGLPKNPPPGLLESMALRQRHDFWLDRDPDQTIGCGFTPDERASMLRDMHRLYEEVQGGGFYKWS